jgi:MFS family permease
MIHDSSTIEGSTNQKSADERRPKHEPVLGGFIYLLTSVSVIGGLLFGYDTGIVSSAMLYIVNNEGMRPINHLWQEWIIAVTPAFAALGSLFAGKLSDKFGRRLLIIASSVVFTLGAILWFALKLSKEQF